MMPRAVRWSARAGSCALGLLLGACATHTAHYYSEDGPPDRVPADIASTPDAVPRDEPINPYANRPYRALGRTYVPETSEAPFTQRGMASWYGRQFQGNRTASGEPYDMFAMTAAHPTLPIPSYARVTSVRDGRSVVVRINDRGPFLYDRIIDLSYAAAVRLGIAVPGSGEVVVERIQVQQLARASAPSGAPPAHTAASTPAAPAAKSDASVGAGETRGPAEHPAPAGVAPPMAVSTAAAGAGNAAGAGTTMAAFDMHSAAGPTQPMPLPVAPLAPAPAAVPAQFAPPPAAGTPASWSVQVGAFAVAANAAALRDRLALLLAAPEAARLPSGARSPRIEQDGRLSRVLIGSLPDRATAQEWARQIGGFLVRETVLYAR